MDRTALSVLLSFLVLLAGCGGVVGPASPSPDGDGSSTPGPVTDRTPTADPVTTVEATPTPAYTPEPVEASVDAFATYPGVCERSSVTLRTAQVHYSNEPFVTLALVGNVSVTNADRQPQFPTLTGPEPGYYVLAVTTTNVSDTPTQPCENGGYAGYEAVLTIPHDSREAFLLDVTHDGAFAGSWGNESLRP